MMKTISKMARVAAVTGMLGLGLTSFAVAQTADRTTTDATTTTNRDDHTDMGWIGLLGLAGLAGLMKRDRSAHATSGSYQATGASRT